MPTTIEIRFKISLATAPIEPLKKLYVSHIGELKRPIKRTALAEPSLRLIVMITMATTGKSSMIRFPTVGFVPKARNVRGYELAKAKIKNISQKILFALVLSLK